MDKKVRLNKNVRNNIVQFLHLLIEQKIKISEAILFGSYAKGRATDDSDIDIAVVSPQFGKNRLKDTMTLRKTAVNVDTRLEPIPLSPSDLNDRYSTLMYEIKKYGQSLSRAFYVF